MEFKGEVLLTIFYHLFLNYCYFKILSFLQNNHNYYNTQFIRHKTKERNKNVKKTVSGKV